MEAEGDPTVFSMNLRAMRASSTDETMVALVPYEAEYAGANGAAVIDAGMVGEPAPTDEQG
jgi:hypothetical protein